MKWLKSVLFILIFCMMVFASNCFLIPEHRYFDGYEENYMQTGKGFSNLPKDSLDVIFMGSSNVFMNISPLDLYSEYGYKSYDLATPMQTLEESFFQLHEAFKTQSPGVVILDCLAFERYVDNGEAYTHMAYDAYPFTFFKHYWLKDNLAAGYDYKSFQIPFLIYHSRFDEMDLSDFDLQYYNEKEDFLGYSPAFSVIPSEDYGLKSGHIDAQFTENDREILEKIIKLCNENNSKLILIKTPCIGSWFKEDSEIMEEVAQKYNLQYWELSEEPTIDKNVDFCDGGGHLNDYGARKMTRAIGERLSHVIGENSIDSDDKWSDYFDKRVYNLGKCRNIQNLKYENDFQEVCNKILDEDYVIFMNAYVSNEKVIAALQTLMECSMDMGTVKIGQHVSIILDRVTDAVKMLNTENDIMLDNNMYKHDIYIENSLKNGSIIQVDYRNYSHKGGDILIVIYDKYYDCVVDSFGVWVSDDSIVVSHI